MTTTYVVQIRSNDRTMRLVPLTSADMTIGTDAGCTVQLTGAGLSPLHARLMFRRGRFFLEDIGSPDGIFANGRRINSGPIATGREFSIGSYVFQVRLDRTQSTARPEVASPVAAAVVPGRRRPIGASDSEAVLGFRSTIEQLVGLSSGAGIADEQAILETLLERSMTLIEAQRGSIVLVQGDTMMAVVSQPGLLHPLSDAGFNRTVCEGVIARKDPVLIRNPDGRGRITGIESSKGGGPGLVIGVPLSHQQVVLGVLYLECDRFPRQAVRDLLPCVQDVSCLGGQMLQVALERQSLIHSNERWRWLANESEGWELQREPKSSSMRAIHQIIRKIAAENVTALILGESGTGKEVVARTVHALSEQRDGPFVAINCGAIPRDLMEGELFGFEKGAFSGAVARKPGRLELAEGGTLLLDEVGELPRDLQVKLLRVLETRQFERLGGGKPIAWNARVLAATNRDIEKLIASGEFREDLYYRLNVISIRLPPLRERREEISTLVDDILRVTNRRFRRKLCGVTPAALNSLVAYHWPGNVRELRNIIERAFFLATDDRITPNCLPFHFPPPGASSVPSSAVSVAKPPIVPLAQFVRNQEVAYIRYVVDEMGGNITRAAELLNMNRSALHRKMKGYGMVDGADEMP